MSRKDCRRSELPDAARDFRNLEPTGNTPDLPESAGQSCAGWFLDRKSTRLNSSQVSISYAVVCLKKKEKVENRSEPQIREENAHTDKIVAEELTSTEQARSRRGEVKRDTEAERKLRERRETEKTC